MLVALEAHLDQQDLVAERRVFEDDPADVVEVHALHDPDRGRRGNRPIVVGVVLEHPVDIADPIRNLDRDFAPGVPHASWQGAREPSRRLGQRRWAVGVAHVVRVVPDQAIGAEPGSGAADRARPTPPTVIVLVVPLRVALADLQLEPAAPEPLVHLALDHLATIVVGFERELWGVRPRHVAQVWPVPRPPFPRRPEHVDQVRFRRPGRHIGEQILDPPVGDRLEMERDGLLHLAADERLARIDDRPHELDEVQKVALAPQPHELHPRVS